MNLRDKIEAHLKSHSDKGENYLFPAADWRYEVDNGDTTASLEGWRETKIEYEADDAMDAIERLLHLAHRPFAGDLSEIEFNERILEVCSELRILDDEAADRARQFLQKDHERGVFGEICGNAPSEVIMDLSRIMHLGMVAYEGRCDADKMDKTIVDFAERNGLDCAPVTAASRRLGLIDDEPEAGLE